MVIAAQRAAARDVTDRMREALTAGVKRRGVFIVVQFAMYASTMAGRGGAGEVLIWGGLLKLSEIAADLLAFGREGLTANILVIFEMSGAGAGAGAEFEDEDTWAGVVVPFVVPFIGCVL